MFSFKNRLTSLYLIFSAFFISIYLFILYNFRPDLPLMDEYRYYTAEWYYNYLQKGFWAFLKAKEAESLPLLQRLVFFTHFKIFGGFSMQTLFLYSLIYLIGIQQLLFSYFKKTGLSFLYFIPVFFSIWNLANSEILWSVGNYFLSTFFLVLLAFHFLVNKPQKSFTILLLFFLAPFGTINAIFGLILGIFYILNQKKYKMAGLMTATLLLLLFIFFKLTAVNNFDSPTENIIKSFGNPLEFLKLFIAIIGTFSVIFSEQQLVINMCLVTGFSFLLATIFLFYKIFILKKTNALANWAILSLVFLIGSLFVISFQKRFDSNIIAIIGVFRYRFFSYLIFLIFYLLIITKYSVYLKSKRVISYCFTITCVIFFVLQQYKYFYNIVYLRNMGASNFYNFTHNFHVDEDNNDRGQSKAVKYLIEHKLFNPKQAKNMMFLDQIDKITVGDNDKLKYAIKVHRPHATYDKTMETWSDFVNIEINNINSTKNIDRTFVIIHNQTGQKYMYYAVPLNNNLISAATSFRPFTNSLRAEFSLNGLKKGVYKVSIVNPDQIIELKNLKLNVFFKK
jgi:hypothetical protein